VPRITAATVAENREMRREALLTAAASLMTRGGAFTVAEVAREVGLSRSAVYEYYSSAAELIADVLVDEMTAWSRDLQNAVAASHDPRDRIHAWLQGVLDYVGDGRHALLRAAGAIEIPAGRRVEMQSLHDALIQPLTDAIADLDDPAPARTSHYVWGVVSVAIDRIESVGTTVEDEAPALTSFIDGALGLG
jgi:AcrR family transcriptional regulator